MWITILLGCEKGQVALWRSCFKIKVDWKINEIGRIYKQSNWCPSFVLWSDKKVRYTTFFSLTVFCWLWKCTVTTSSLAHCSWGTWSLPAIAASSVTLEAVAAVRFSLQLEVKSHPVQFQWCISANKFWFLEISYF